MIRRLVTIGRLSGGKAPMLNEVARLGGTATKVSGTIAETTWEIRLPDRARSALTDGIAATRIPKSWLDDARRAADGG